MDNAERTKFLARIMYLVKSVNAQKEEIVRVSWGFCISDNKIFRYFKHFNLDSNST